jgi:arylsulfatase A-like enzyme
VRDAYVAFDRALGRVLEAFGRDATVVVVSDHGHGPWFTWFGRGTPGGHTDAPDGIFVAAGPGIRPGMPDAFAPSVLDVTPTVLRLLDLPAGADMEGRALDEILRDPVPIPAIVTWETGEAPTGPPPPAESDEAMLERLRALGYLR